MAHANAPNGGGSLLRNPIKCKDPESRQVRTRQQTTTRQEEKQTQENSRSAQTGRLIPEWGNIRKKRNSEKQHERQDKGGERQYAGLKTSRLARLTTTRRQGRRQRRRRPTIQSQSTFILTNQVITIGSLARMRTPHRGSQGVKSLPHLSFMFGRADNQDVLVRDTRPSHTTTKGGQTTTLGRAPEYNPTTQGKQDETTATRRRRILAYAD